MAEHTNISWADSTWNAALGCSHVSEGCRNCYAEELATLFGWTTKPWTAPNAAENVILKPHKLDLPLRWSEPKRIFVNSLSDVFHEQIPDDYIDMMCAIMAASPRHTYQVLTKRPSRMRDYIQALTWGRLLNAWDYLRATQPWVAKNYPKPLAFYATDHCDFPLPNLWLGTSVEDQRAANERIPLLLQTPAVVRFLGEPVARVEAPPGVSWCIAGGEFGPHYRPMDLDWARALRDQCVDAGVAYFFKQGAHRRPGQDTLLDGREWHEFPEVQ